jgi:hypothetical protein
LKQIDNAARNRLDCLRVEPYACRCHLSRYVDPSPEMRQIELPSIPSCPDHPDDQQTL